MTHDVERHEGPVLVTVEYRIDPRDRAQFLAAMDQLGYERRRNGACGWGVFEDSASEGMLETFLVESWLEHLRQRERVTRLQTGTSVTIRPLMLTLAQRVSSHMS